MTRARTVPLLIAGAAVLAGSFGVAAAGERKDPVVQSGVDCGCTAGARAKDRVERGLVPGTPQYESNRR
jgi:hypothetical protein